MKRPAFKIRNKAVLSEPLNGGPRVHPIPAPFSSKAEFNNKNNEFGKIQKVIY